MIGRLIGNYKVLEKIGEGGMGSVWRGVDIMLDREVAIKMLRPELANDPLIAARILAAYLKDHEGDIRAALSRGDLAAARKAVNGGTHGLDQFQLAFQRGVALT